MTSESVCNYCNAKFKNNSMLTRHKSITKYCLILQGKIEDDKADKEKKKDEMRKIEIERSNKEKEDRREARFRCEFCKVKLTTRINYCGHIDICLEKYKKIIEEKDREKEKIIEEKDREKEKIIEEYKVEIKKMKNKWRTKKEKFRLSRSRVNHGNNNTTTNNTINNNVIILQATDLSEEKLFDVFSYYGKEYFNRGSSGVADFIQKNIITGSNGESTVICTDVSRKMFYNNINGKQVKDPGLIGLYSRLDPWIKKGNDRVYGEEWIEISEKGGDYVRETKNELKMKYRDASNKAKIIKRLAEFSYVGPLV
jgi:hypothetical protein